MKKYGDLISVEEVDPDIKDKLKNVFREIGKRAKLEDVWEKLSFKYSKQEYLRSGQFVTDDGDTFVYYENGYVFFDYGIYNGDPETGIYKWKRKDTLYKTFDLYIKYLSLYSFDINMALKFNLDYEKAEPLASDTSQKNKYIACYEGMAEDEQNYYIPFSLKEEGNHGTFCEYTWKSLFKPSHSMKNIKRSKDKYYFDDIIDIVTLNPEYEYELNKYTQEEKINLSDIKSVIGCTDLPPTKAERKIKNYIFSKDKKGFKDYKSDLRAGIGYLVFKNKLIKITDNDFWITEKIFAVNSILDYLDATGYDYRRDFEYLYVYLDTVFEIMLSCKPIYIRRILIRITGLYIKDMFLEKPSYDEEAIKKEIIELEIRLTDTVKKINLQYQSLLKILYDEIHKDEITYEKQTYMTGNNVLGVVYGYEHTGMMRQAIKKQFIIPELIGEFERNLNISKELIKMEGTGKIKKGLKQRYGQLQHMAVVKAYEEYHR